MSEEINEQKIELPTYMVNEAGENIFDLKLDGLVFEKMIILFERLQPAQYKLMQAKVELQNKNDKLILETDFKKELNDSRPTVAMKEAYMRKFTAELEGKVSEMKEEVEFYKNKLTILNDLIKVRRVELNILNEED